MTDVAASVAVDLALGKNWATVVGKIEDLVHRTMDYRR